MDDADRAKLVEQQHRQAALEAALSPEPLPAQRLDANGNAVCIDCGDAIPPQRLDVMPGAARCVGCKALVEQKKECQ